MKFENKGKWLKEAEDKLAAYDTQEHPDLLDGDNKVCTFEDDEMHDFEEDELDVVEEDDTLDSPEEEEDALMLDESFQKNEASKKTFSVRRLDSRTIKLKDNAGKLYLMQLTDFGPSNLEADIEDYVKDKLHGKLLNLDYDHDAGRGIMDVMIESSQKNEDNSRWKELSYSTKDNMQLVLHFGDYYATVNFSPFRNKQEVTIGKDFNVLAKKSGFSTIEQAKDWAEKALKRAIKGQKIESSQKNEDNASELKKELNNLYRGIGWAEWDYFKEGLAYSTNFKPDGMSDSDLEKMTNASGIAKVKKVKEIRNYSSMEDFDAKDFRPDDKIIVTKKPMSSQFHGESSQKNEDFDTYAIAWQEFDRQDRIVGKQKEFKTAKARDSFVQKLKDSPKFYKILGYSDPEITESSQKNEDRPNNSSSLPYVVADSRLQPIEYFKDARTANDYVMSVKKKSGIKTKDLDMFIYQTDDLRKRQTQRYGKTFESSQKNEANIDEEAAYKLAELLCGNINYKQAEFTNIRRQMQGHKLKVDFKGKTITINCLS